MAATRITHSSLLNRVYLPKIRTQFNLKSVLLQRLQRKTETMAEGERIEVKLHVGQSGGIGWSSTGQLPAASHQRTAVAFYGYRRHYGRMEIDGSLIDQKRNSATIIDHYEFETDNLVKQLRRDVNFDLWGDGSGLKAQVATATAARTLTVTSVAGLATGQVVSVLLIADGSVGAGVAGVPITIDPQSNTVTIDATAAGLGDFATVNASAALYGFYRANSYNQVISGLRAIVDHHNPAVRHYGGIDRSVPAGACWNALVVANGGVARRVSFPLIADTIEQAQAQSDGEIDLIGCNPLIYNQLSQELLVDRRFDGKTTKLNGWAEAIQFTPGGPAIFKDTDCPVTQMYLLDTESLVIRQSDGGAWMDKDGSVLARVPGYDAYEASWRHYLELCCDACNKNARIDDLDPTPIA